MKKLIHTTIIILATVFYVFTAVFSASCENKWPHDGELGGMWQLMSVEKDGEVNDMKQEKSFWSFRNGLLQFTNTKDNADAFNLERMYSLFNRQGNTLVLTDFCTNSINLSTEDNNEWVNVANKDAFYKYGIYAVEDASDNRKITTKLNIILLDDGKMILESDSARLAFRKF